MLLLLVLELCAQRDRYIIEKRSAVVSLLWLWWLYVCLSSRVKNETLATVALRSAVVVERHRGIL